TNLVSLAGKTKTLFSMELSKQVENRSVSAGVTVKTRGGINGEDMIFTGFGSIEDPGDKAAGRESWKVKMTFDPLMKGSKHLLTFNGKAGKTSVSAVLPEVEQYHELGVALSDIPGAGAVLSNIPLPVPGAKAAVDAGFSLKYNAPVKKGLLINEIETNPAGEDRGSEWIELFNNSDSAVELEGYTLTASSDWRKKVMPLSGSISPGELVLVEPDFVMVNSSGKYTRSGEAVTLKDPDGNAVDKTPTVRDDKDSGFTWHREFDGSTKWVLSEGTPGASNGSQMHAVISPGDLKDIAWDAITEAFGDIGYITDMESLKKFTERLVFHAIDGTISKISGCIAEASLYVSVEITDLSSSVSGGFRIALRTDSQLAEDCMKYIAGKLESVLLGIDDPYAISIGKAFMEDIDLEISAGTEIGFPKILGRSLDYPDIRCEAVFRTNLASISGLFGEDAGRPETVFGVRLRGCPLGGLPGGLSADPDMERDLWLLKISVVWRGLQRI
ncbi:MAG: lamin tail domain-containing protein, partial [Candidatus Methanomethylophilaceae archaeon]|nr:lamin tail domain-containing protein [Candidatus Methanomethylophilaceae archaeon]